MSMSLPFGICFENLEFYAAGNDQPLRSVIKSYNIILIKNVSSKR